MKIYTKGGDTGQTSLFGGTRLSKSHVRIESYGNVDELNSHLGLIRDLIEDVALREELKNVQETLFTIGSHLAADPSKENLWLPEIKAEELKRLEDSIDVMQDALPELKFFILPGGHPTVSHCHIARCVCRRAERSVVALKDIDQVNEMILTYLNRLSDYLFVLSRHLGKELGADEVKWDSR